MTETPLPRRNVQVVTTMTACGYARYGRWMIESFDRHWATDVQLLVYTEGFDLTPASPRIRVFDLEERCDGLVAFKRRHAANPEAHGRLPWWSVRLGLRESVHGGRRLKVLGRGYRWDAVRFSHKVFATLDAARTSGADVLIWIDADTRFFADVCRDRTEGFVPEGRFVGCLKRASAHTECGFVAYDLTNDATQAMLRDLAAMYDSDALFAEEEYHDSYLFDVVRERQERAGHVSHDIAEGIGDRAHHVLINSPLGTFMDHMKGECKEQRSASKNLVVDRGESYWRVPISPTEARPRSRFGRARPTPGSRGVSPSRRPRRP